MPINRKDFEKGNFKKRNNNRENHPISLLLKNNSNKAFTSKEIAKKCKMNHATVISMLCSLRKNGFVLHKSPFFAWKKVSKK